MSRLDRELDVVHLARDLGLGRREPVNVIIVYCLEKIRQWLGGEELVQTITDLERLVCRKLRLVFEEIWTDEDLSGVARKYIALGEGVFATLKQQFDEKTYATLMERRRITAADPDRYVAVIDCRGDKGARRFFTRWHEIAHLLTLSRQLELPFHRSREDRSPLERLMDLIAGEVGFYAPLFTPILQSVLMRTERLSFADIESVRLQFCEAASFQATVYAALRHTPEPTIYLEAGMGFKKEEEAKLRSKQRSLFPIEPPVAKLRVLEASGNEAARRTGFRIDGNMQVPPGSLITKCFDENEESSPDSIEGKETLTTWVHSDGSALGRGDIHVEAKRQQDRVIALIQRL